MLTDGEIAMAAAAFMMEDLTRIARDGPRNTKYDRRLCQFMARCARRELLDSDTYKRIRAIVNPKVTDPPASGTGDAR